MTHPNKVRGNSLEREIVQQAAAKGLPAKRAWSSDGRSFGEHETVDCMIAGLRIQAKRRKKIAQFLQVPVACDAVIVREDRGKSIVLISYERFLELLVNTEDD